MRQSRWNHVASALFAGLPATGALARTATNVRSGARSPVAGMLHAIFLLVFVLVLAPWMRYIPLAALAAVLLIVAWNRAEMHRMSEVVAIGSNVSLLDEDVDDFVQETQPNQRAQLPESVEVFQVSGPLFFAVANRLDDVLNQFPKAPRVFILRMRSVPLIDSSSVTALRQLLTRGARSGTRVILSGLREQPRSILNQMGIRADGTRLQFASDFREAVSLAGPEAAG